MSVVMKCLKVNGVWNASHIRIIHCLTVSPLLQLLPIDKTTVLSGVDGQVPQWGGLVYTHGQPEVRTCGC